ncbi:MAG TPA: hypothetical protein VJU60_10425 [Thermoleophilaceae bacterium]|nr:hypothetical protein [Thermoleophilaceae bacterium]
MAVLMLVYWVISQIPALLSGEAGRRREPEPEPKPAPPRRRRSR